MHLVHVASTDECRCGLDGNLLDQKESTSERKLVKVFLRLTDVSQTEASFWPSPYLQFPQVSPLKVDTETVRVAGAEELNEGE